MSAVPVVVRPEETLRNVYRLMSEHRIRHVPVVSADGVVGVIS
ncbi:MAG: CBS domain-containing protein, partial [Candidatus Methylomirabilales bacterium]